MCIPGGIKVISQKNFAWRIFEMKYKLYVLCDQYDDFEYVAGTVSLYKHYSVHHIGLDYNNCTYLYSTPSCCFNSYSNEWCYFHHSSNCKFYNVTSCSVLQSWGARHGFIAAVARKTTTREESCQGHVYFLLFLPSSVIKKYVVIFFSQSFGNLYPSFSVWSTTLLLLN